MECATGSLLPVQARAGKPPVAPKLYEYPIVIRRFQGRLLAIYCG